MTRLVRRVAALLATFALVFAQLAVSAYACPVESAPEVAPSGVLGGGHLPCADLQSPNLCDSHCGYGSSAAGQGASVPLPEFVATPLRWRIAEAGSVTVAARTGDEALLRIEPPPPLILFGVLRI